MEAADVQSPEWNLRGFCWSCWLIILKCFIRSVCMDLICFLLCCYCVFMCCMNHKSSFTHTQSIQRANRGFVRWVTRNPYHCLVCSCQMKLPGIFQNNSDSIIGLKSVLVSACHPFQDPGCLLKSHMIRSLSWTDPTDLAPSTEPQTFSKHLNI